MQLVLRLRGCCCDSELAFGLRDAGESRRCHGCQASIRVPPLGKPVRPGHRDTPPSSTDRCLRIWALGAAAALVLAPTTWWLSHRRELANAEDRANQTVAAKVEAARAEVTRQRWEEAAALLQTALSTERATELDQAHALWTHVRRERASARLRAAESALADRRAAEASN